MSTIIDRAERALRAHRHRTTEVQAVEVIRSIRDIPEELLYVDIGGRDAPTRREIWNATIDGILGREK